MKLEQVKQYPKEQYDATLIILKEVLCLVRKHKKASIILGLFIMWDLSLVFHHLSELKSLWEAVPFLH